MHRLSQRLHGPSVRSLVVLNNSEGFDWACQTDARSSPLGRAVSLWLISFLGHGRRAPIEGTHAGVFTNSIERPLYSLSAPCSMATYVDQCCQFLYPGLVGTPTFSISLPFPSPLCFVFTTLTVYFLFSFLFTSTVFHESTQTFISIILQTPCLPARSPATNKRPISYTF